MGSRRINSQCEQKESVGDFIKGWLDHALQPGISVSQTWGTVKHMTYADFTIKKGHQSWSRRGTDTTNLYTWLVFLFHIIHVYSLVVLVIKSGTIIPVDFHVLERIAQPRAIWDARDELWSVGEGEKEDATIDIWMDMLCTQWLFHVFPHPSMRSMGFCFHQWSRRSGPCNRWNPKQHLHGATVDGCEILHHLGWLKPYKQWDNQPINWCSISSIHSIFHFL